MKKMIPALLALTVLAGSAAFAEETKTAAPATNTKQTTKAKKHHKRVSLKKSAKINSAKENNEKK